MLWQVVNGLSPPKLSWPTKTESVLKLLTCGHYDFEIKCEHVGSTLWSDTYKNSAVITRTATEWCLLWVSSVVCGSVDNMSTVSGGNKWWEGHVNSCHFSHPWNFLPQFQYRQFTLLIITFTSNKLWAQGEWFPSMQPIFVVFTIIL
jgi:hypothetical protein